MCRKTLVDVPSCRVVSIGVNYDAKFDIALSRDFNCEVHAFDPTTPCHPSLLWRNVFFHPIGLGSEKRLGRCGRTETLSRVIDGLQGEEGERFSVLKIDCEGCEWGAFETVYDMGDKGVQLMQRFDEVHF